MYSTEVVEYTASDGLTDTATLTVTVTGANDGLTANDDAGTTTENKILMVADGATGTRVGGGAQRVNADLLLNDVDIDGDDLTITEVDGDTGSVGKATSGVQWQRWRQLHHPCQWLLGIQSGHGL